MRERESAGNMALQARSAEFNNALKAKTAQAAATQKPAARA
jgi:hypothetical protein